MKTFKKNLPEGVKKQFALYKDENPSFFDKISYVHLSF